MGSHIQNSRVLISKTAHGNLDREGHRSKQYRYSGRIAAMAMDATNPTIRFVAVDGNALGVCPHCGVKGPAGKLCYTCCDAADMTIGTCPTCQDTGPLGDTCTNCTRFHYLDEPPWGKCRNCCDEGIVHARCSKCLGDSTYACF